MEWLNYHHLLYFWVVARGGSLASASEELGLAPSTVSGQIRLFEKRLGHKLFTKSGRRLALTEMGRIVYRYADEIFSLGREMQDTLHDRPVGRPLCVTVGVADVVPKLVAQRLLEPALQPLGQVRLVCREGKPDRLLADLALHELDMILTDSPAGPGGRIRAFSHLLGSSGISFFGRKDVVARAKGRFPSSLNGIPLLLPTENTVLRRSLDQWFESVGVRPVVVGEFEDSALLSVFGQRGAGLFPAPTVIAREVEQQYLVLRLGEVKDVHESFYAITVERRIKHPAVVAICDEARRALFRTDGSASAAPSRRGHRSKSVTGSKTMTVTE
jgi:LysR family transcriptional activator of nhaA